MAKDSADKAKKKKKKAVSADVGGVRIKVKATKKPRGAGKAKKASSSGHAGLEVLAKLADHPIIADLIAVGATAAVAAVAERGLSSTKAKKSGNAAKAAGKAAAAAIGRRLMTEFNAVKDAAKKKS